MGNAVIVTPDSTLAAGPTLPLGWSRVTDTPNELKAYKRRAVFSGVKTSIDDAYAAIKTFFGDNALGVSVNSSGASGVGEISVDYSTSIGTASPGDPDPDSDPMAPDTYQLQPVTIPTALAAHPVFATITGTIEIIDDALEHGDKAYAVFAAGSDSNAQKYLALRCAGVTQWEAPSYVWRVTRHYSVLADMSKITAAATAVMQTGQVFTWAQVQGHTKIDEPMYMMPSSDGSATQAASYEWRLAGVTVSRTEDNLDITWEYQGAWAWSAALYVGGTWLPTVPQ